MKNDHIILIGFKHVGKSTIGLALAKELHRPFFDLDQLIETSFSEQHGQVLSVRVIMQQYGEPFFRQLEHQVLTQALQATQSPVVMALGGGTAIQDINQKLIQSALVLHITREKNLVFEAISKQGRPAFFPAHLDMQNAFNEIWNQRIPLYEKLAHYTCGNDSPIHFSIQKILTVLSYAEHSGAATQAYKKNSTPRTSPQLILNEKLAGQPILTEECNNSSPQGEGPEWPESTIVNKEGNLIASSAGAPSNKVIIHLLPQPTNTYTIHIQPGLLTNFHWLPKYEKIIIITDHHVKKLYGQSLSSSLSAAGYCVLLLDFPAGESSKCAKIKQRLEEKMLIHRCGRDSLIIALGGGVVGDIAGFIAATYMRGIPYIQIPTTLLAMIDSSVGGKVGINTPQGKNLIGSFWQPRLVIMDTNVLNTLSKKHRTAGLIEAIKIFLTCDSQQFFKIEQHLPAILSLDTRIIIPLIHAAVSLKAKIVQQDEKENGLRMILNCGHTIGHALESITHYRLIHGLAVAYGILVEAKISQLMGLLAATDYQRISALFAALGIHAQALQQYSVHAIIEATQSDKKAHANTVRYILLQGLGSVHESQGIYAHSVPESIIHSAFFNLTEK